MILLIILFLLFFTILSWKNQRWAIFIILATLPSYAVRFTIVSIPMTLLETMLLILLFTWLIKKNNLFSLNKIKKLPACLPPVCAGRAQADAGRLIPNYKLSLPIFLFLISATISVFISPDKISALGIWKAYFIEPVLFLIVFIDVLKENKKFYNFIAYALSIPALYISIFAVYQKFTGFLVPAEYWQASYHRVTSFFSYPNAIGLLLAPIVIILLGALISSFSKEPALSLPKGELRGIFQKTNRGKLNNLIFYSLTIILSIAAIIFAKSEGAIIALIAGAFIFAFIYNKKSRVIAGIIMLLILLSGAGAYFKYGKEWNELFTKTNLFELDNACSYISPFNKGGLRGIFQSNSDFLCPIYQKLTLQDLSGTLRRQMWQETLAMLKKHPIFGAGLAGYQETMKPYHTKKYVEIYLYPHNIILNFWSETGLLGLITLIWIIILFYISAFRLLNKKELRMISAIFLTSMSVLLIHGLVDVPYFKNDLAILFWIIWGMMITMDLYYSYRKTNSGIFKDANSL